MFNQPAVLKKSLDYRRTVDVIHAFGIISIIGTSSMVLVLHVVDLLYYTM